jgi:iron complex outermembrane receptor protein
MTDTEIEKTTVTTAIGKKIPMTPDYTNSLSIDYDRRISDGAKLLTNLEWQLTGPMWFDIYNSPQTGREEFSLVNARLAIEMEHGDNTWQAAAWARNLLDKHYNIYSAPVPPIANFSYRAAPRSYGLDLTYRF